MKGLLVISTAIQDSRRSVNQLQGRAGRQGDPGETLTFYDFNDVVLQGDPTLGATSSECPLMFLVVKKATRANQTSPRILPKA